MFGKIIQPRFSYTLFHTMQRFRCKGTKNFSHLQIYLRFYLQRYCFNESFWCQLVDISRFIHFFPKKAVYF